MNFIALLLLLIFASNASCNSKYLGEGERKNKRRRPYNPCGRQAESRLFQENISINNIYFNSCGGAFQSTPIPSFQVPPNRPVGQALTAFAASVANLVNRPRRFYGQLNRQVLRPLYNFF